MQALLAALKLDQEQRMTSFQSEQVPCKNRIFTHFFGSWKCNRRGWSYFLHFAYSNFYT